MENKNFIWEENKKQLYSPQIRIFSYCLRKIILFDTYPFIKEVFLAN